MKKNNRKNQNKYLFLIFLIFIFSSCSNTAKSRKDLIIDKKVEKISNFSPEKDPLESLNRRVYYFNYLADKYALTPIVDIYKFITPDPVEKGITNFFRNVKFLDTAANATLQLKGRKAMRSVARFTINAIFGIGGLFDVASKMGLPKPYEDFGLTLARYGVPKGPYLVLPFLGPSYLRDAVGLALNSTMKPQIDPYSRMSLFALNDREIMGLMLVDKRKNIKFNYYQTGSPFEYEYIRYLYYKYRTLQEETGVSMF